VAVHVKICGLTEPDSLRTAVEAGARFVGFVFYEPSVRNVSVDTAYELVQMLPTGVRAVGLFVDPSDEFLQAVCGRVQLDMVQLHGGESARRVAEVKALTGCQVMKAIPVAEGLDMDAVRAYEAHADWILFDTPSAGHGGSGQAFDWSILAGYEGAKPWMLAGGLTVDNVGEALAQLSPTAVDVSSGVEKSRGVKDESQIRAFIGAVKAVLVCKA
jgi:phosphoribosylanthranilate isomerase